MDRVRLGRALGYGARHAARTLTQAVDAASAPNPSPKTGSAAPPRQAPPQPSVERRTVEQHATEAIGKLRTTSKQARQVSGSLLQPVKRFSSVLWLEVTGAFFALIAVSIALGAWRMRGMLHPMAGSHEMVKVFLLVAAFVAFTYFAVSNFVRAARR